MSQKGNFRLIKYVHLPSALFYTLNIPLVPTSDLLYRAMPYRANTRTNTYTQIYPPHSFSPSSLNPTPSPNARQPLLGPPNRIAKQIDAFHISQSDPLDHIFNPAMSRAFVNQMGRIKTRAETGLTWRNQRKVGKLVRRARAMGLISRWTDRGVTDEFR